MSAVIEETNTHPLLAKARSSSRTRVALWRRRSTRNLAQSGDAVLVDAVPKSASSSATSRHRARCLGHRHELDAQSALRTRARCESGKDKVILLLCRSGKRSALAGEVATKFDSPTRSTYRKASKAISTNSSAAAHSAAGAYAVSPGFRIETGDRAHPSTSPGLLCAPACARRSGTTQ